MKKPPVAGGLFGVADLCSDIIARSCVYMQESTWPAALSPEEEVFFVASIPRGASLEELGSAIDAEKRRRLDRQAHPERHAPNLGFALVVDPSHP